MGFYISYIEELLANLKHTYNSIFNIFKELSKAYNSKMKNFDSLIKGKAEIKISAKNGFFSRKFKNDNSRRVPSVFEGR